MSPVYWSTGGNFLAAPENKHINIMNIRGSSYKSFVFQILQLLAANNKNVKFIFMFCNNVRLMKNSFFQYSAFYIKIKRIK